MLPLYTFKVFSVAVETDDHNEQRIHFLSKTKRGESFYYLHVFQDFQKSDQFYVSVYLSFFSYYIG